MKDFGDAVKSLPPQIRQHILNIPERVMCDVREIRLRSSLPVSLTVRGEIMYLCPEGSLTCLEPEKALIMSRQELAQAAAAVCRYSVYTCAEGICSGFVTLSGGHRAGICGTASREGDTVTGVRDFTSLCIRIARDVPSCSADILRLTDNARGGLLVAGPPLSGKTTILRDMCMRLSDGVSSRPQRVAVVDERAEIGAKAEGAAGRYLGLNTDVLSLYPKGAGIEIALRCFSPDVIVIDEIGGREDAEQIAAGVNSGVTFAASAHASSREELVQRPQIRRLLECGAFGSVVILKSGEPGTVEGVYGASELLGRQTSNGEA